MGKDYTKDYLNQLGAPYGLTDITEEEWRTVCEADGVTPRVAAMVAITRIRNRRNNVAAGIKQQMESEKEMMEGIFIGSRDMTWKDMSLEKTTGLRCEVLVDNHGYKELVDWAKWGESDLWPGTRYQFEIATTQKTDTKTGKLETRTKIRKAVKIQDQVFSSVQDLLAMGIQVLEPGQITEIMKQQHVCVKGEIASAWYEPRWVGGNQDEENPMHLYHNNQPCFQAILKGEGPTRVKLRLEPTKNGRPLLAFEDLGMICSSNKIDDVINSLVGRTVIATGSVSRFNAGDVSWADISVHSFWEADFVQVPQQNMATPQQALPGYGQPQGPPMTPVPQPVYPPPQGTSVPQPIYPPPQGTAVPQPMVPPVQIATPPQQMYAPPQPQPFPTNPPAMMPAPAPVPPPMAPVPPQAPPVQPPQSWPPQPPPSVPMAPPAAPVPAPTPVAAPPPQMAPVQAAVPSGSPAPSEPAGHVDVAKVKIEEAYQVFGREITIKTLKENGYLNGLQISPLVLERVVLMVLASKGHSDVTVEQVRAGA